MVRNILIAVIVCVLLYLGYFAYKTRADKVAVNGGDFTCQGCDTPEQHAQFLKENSGETADGDSERKPTSARVAAEQAATGQPAAAPRSFGTDAAAAAAAPAGTSSMVEPAPVMSAPVVVPTTPDPAATVAGAAPPSLPATDSVSPNPPNGMTFAGKGTYQWYRQGNLTWRVDTTSGRSCIIYATMEEWRKRIVLSHGCGSNA